MLPPLYFLHLDRSGGTSIIHVLRSVYERSGQFCVRTDAPAAAVNGLDCICGHFPLNAIAGLPNRLLVTVLRHPVDRELSVLNKAAMDEPHSVQDALRVRAATRDMDAYIEAFIHDGLYASRYSLGAPSITNACASLSAFNLVGITSRLEDFHERLMDLLHCTSTLPRANASNPRFTFTPNQRDRITARLPNDIAIYEHAATL